MKISMLRPSAFQVNAGVFARALCAGALAVGLIGAAQAQVSGTKNIPGDYPDLAAAVADVNTIGVAAGGATLNLLAGNAQTAPAGGYSITTLTTSAANPLAIVGNSNTVTANAALTSGAFNDAIFKIIGSDNVTLSGFTMNENAANLTTAAATNNMTEFGVALFYASATDNSQNITIQNNVITLNRAYQNTFGIYANATHTAAAVTVSASATGATGGNNGLKIYSNTISNVNNGISVIGPTAAADVNDGVDIGGSSAATANTLSNFGTTNVFTAFANFPTTLSVSGVLIRNSKNFNVSFNSIASSTSAVAPIATSAGTLRAIYVPAFSAAPTGTIVNSMNNNAIALRGGAAAVVLQGIVVEVTTVNVTTTTNINSNNFTDASWNVAATGTTTFISNLGVGFNANINSNTFTNLSLNSSGAVTFIANGFSLSAGGTKNVNTNSVVTAFNKTVAGGTVTLYLDNASSVAGSFANNNNNNFSNMTFVGATSLAGWSNTDGSGLGSITKVVDSNTFSNWSNGGASNIIGLTVNFSGTATVSNNLISGFSGGNTVNGIVTASGGTTSISQNTVHTLSSSGAATVVTGILSTSGTTINVARNKIYNLSETGASGVVNGITSAGGTTQNFFNNLVGDLLAPNASLANAVNGLNLTGGTTVNASFNTVRLAATSVGANFGTTAINATATPATINLRSNNFVNLSTPAGTGLAVAYRRASAVLTNYGAASNNNNFYAGTPGVSNVIFFDGATSDQTLTAYKGRVAARDSASVSESPPFVSTTGSTSNYLHISLVTPTQLESNGLAVSGITDDFDADVRNASTPDIGADEFNGIILDLNGPSISYAGFGNTTLFSNRVLAATITDPSGVAGGGNAPRIYFRKGAGSYFSTQCTGSAPSFSCTIDNALVGGVAVSDVVSYFVIAQDVPGNVSSSPGAGLVASNVNTVTTPPTTPSSYNITVPFPSTVNVGTAETITSLTNAGGLFALMNAGVLTSNVVVNITSDLAAETGLNALNSFAEEPAGSNFTLRIFPAGSPRVITGAFNGVLIRLNGASRVTIDGSLGGTGTDRSLTIQNTSVTTPGVVLIGSLGTTPITNVTLKNSIIINGVTTSSAVVISDATTSGSAGLFSNITIQNNDVQKAFVGVFATGGTTPQGGSNLVYTQNTLNTVGANAIRQVGLYMQGVNGATVTQNTVGNFSAVEGENDTGIWLATGTANATVSGNTVSNLGMTLTTSFAPFGMRESSGVTPAGINFSGNTVSTLSTTGSAAIRGISASSSGITIQRNNIQDVKNNNITTFGAYGIDVSAGNDDIIQNNFVSDINHVMTGGGAFDTQFGVFGIRLGAGTGHKVYFNSVNLFGLKPGTANSALLSTAFGIVATTQTGIDVRNNIFANNVTGGTTSLARVSVFLPSGGTSAMNLTWNNNAYYFGTDAAAQGIAQIGISAGTGFITTLPALAAYTSTLSAAGTNDNASIAANTAVPFTSNTNLHVGVGSAVVNVGTPIAGVTIDIDGDPRSAPAPEIGADELVDPNTAPSITPAVGVTRQQGTGVSNSTIATVTDVEQPVGSLVVTAPTVPAGLTVSSIVNSTGTVTANLVAACGATLGANTVGLSVSDGLLSTAGNLSVNVTANAVPTLGSYGATTLIAGNGTTVTPSAAPTDNGSVASVTAAAPGFTGTFSGNAATGVITISNAGPASGTPYLVTVTATDNCGSTSTSTFNLTVNAPNSAPTITPAAGVTRQAGSAVSNSTIATVSDLEQSAGSLVVTAPTVPAGLTVTSIVNTTGTVSANLVAACGATVGANAVGLSVSDGLLSTAGSLSVNVTANGAPTLGSYGATSLALTAGTTVTPSAAPTDNGSVVSVSAAATGFTGTFSGNAGTGVITISNAGPASVTPYVVTVTATDNCGLTSTATFNLTVNSAPTITPAVGVTRQQGSAVSNSTIATVSDGEQAPGTLVVTAPTVPAGLTLSTIANTTGTVTANLVAACSATLGANTVGLSVSDGTLSTAGNLSVNVTANGAPTLGSYGATSLVLAAGTTVTPSAAPTDNGSVVSVSAAAPGFTGTFSANAGTGVITISNAGPASATPYVVTVTATDNCGLTSTATFNLTVNSAPTITPAVGVTRQQGSTVSNSTIATVSDGEQAAGTLVVTAPTVPAGLTLSTIVNTTGTVTANLVAACSATLGANSVGLSVSDGTLSTAGNLSVNVTANSAPVLGTYGATTATTGGTNTSTPSAAPSDNGSVVSVTASAPGFTGTLTGNAATGVITIANAGPVGSYVVTVTATDNCGSTSTRTFNLDVSNFNSAPTITPAVGVTRQQGSTASSSTIATVSDAESSAGSLTVTAPTVPAGLSITGILNTSGTVAGSVAAACTATLGANAVVLNVSDGSLNTNGNLSINVTANSAPVLGSYGAATAVAGSGTTVTPSAAPTDNGSVTVTAAATGFTGTFSGNSSTGVITVSNAGPASVTPYVVTVTATDNCGSTSTTTFNLTVNPSNTAPTITPAVGVTRQQGSAASSSTIATVSDLEQTAGSLVVTAPTVPAGLTLTGIANSTGTVSASVAAACTATVGNNTVGLSVSDGSLSTSGSLVVAVTANSAPVLGTYGATSVATAGAATVTPTAAPTDNGSVATLTASAPGFTGTLTGNPSTGVISISGAAPASATAYVVTVTATDNCGLTSTTTFNLTVRNTANLDVSKDDGVTTYRAGDLLVYTLVLRNLGPDSANGAVFTDTVPATLINAIWTCVAANGAACPQTGGSGSINATVAVLPATGRLTYTLQANVATPIPAQVSNTAQVSITGLAVTDPQLANNSATDTDLPEAIFRNGFEDAIVPLIDKANGQQSIPLANLSQILDDTARIVFSAEDANGEALRVYGRRNDAGEVELALALRDADGLLRLGAWQRFTSNVANISYVARGNVDGFVLQSARFE